ncbi:MAG: hypothetical protein FWD81_04010 [Methanomassiliicoccaceae archaeon]|nr:hypothetical protein [Methanomassiliicoccaceae archaeon]
MVKKDAALVIMVLIFSMIIVGQALSYFAVPYNYGASAETTSDGVMYTATSNSSVSYTVLAYDNAKPIDTLHIYYDASHAVYGTSHASQKSFISQLSAELEIRGFVGSVKVTDAAGLLEVVDAAYEPGDAILITSGVLPKGVYDGETNFKIFDWVRDGGSLYWAGYAIGGKYADGKTLMDAPATYQSDIFGVPDSILTEQRTSTERSGDLSKALMLSRTNVTYGLNVTAVPDTLSVGFEYTAGSGDVYSSIALTQYDDGMICVMGGMSRTSIAQIIASGITPSSTLIGTDGGSLVRGGVAERTIPLSGETDVAVQIRIGDPNVVYARTIFL